MVDTKPGTPHDSQTCSSLCGGCTYLGCAPQTGALAKRAPDRPSNRVQVLVLPPPRLLERGGGVTSVQSPLPVCERVFVLLVGAGGWKEHVMRHANGQCGCACTRSYSVPQHWLLVLFRWGWGFKSMPKHWPLVLKCFRKGVLLTPIVQQHAAPCPVAGQVLVG